MNKRPLKSFKIKKLPEGMISVEHFVHFQCASCKGWWGIGDAPDRKEWICPWCGLKQTFVDKTPKVIKYR